MREVCLELRVLGPVPCRSSPPYRGHDLSSFSGDTCVTSDRRIWSEAGAGCAA